MKDYKTIFTILLLIIAHQPVLHAQSDLERTCFRLNAIMFSAHFSRDAIWKSLDTLMVVQSSATKEEFDKCNCADSLRIQLQRSKYRLAFNQEYDTVCALNAIIENVELSRFRFILTYANAKSPQDSFPHIVNQIRRKLALKELYPTGRCGMMVVNYEIDFISRNEANLYKECLAIFDDQQEKYKIRKLMLRGLDCSNYYHPKNCYDDVICNELSLRFESLTDSTYYHVLRGIIRRRCEK